MNLDTLTERSQQTIAAAIQLARDHANAQVHPAHIGAALLNEGTGPDGVVQGDQSTTSLFASVIEKAGGDKVTVKRGLQKIIIRLPSQSPPPEEVSFTGMALKVLREAAVVKTVIQQIRGNRRIESRNAEAGFEALQKYAVDLTALAEEGKIDPVIGRDNEIRRVIRILCRRTKNNPVLIGEPGVGKTSIVEGLAQRIVNRDVPASLFGRLFSLDMGALMAGAKYKGEYEERIKSVLNEVEKSAEQGNQLHLIMAGRGAEGGGMDAGNLFKPLWPEASCGALKYIETDAALERRFAQVITINILRGIREKYEVHHGVRILDGAMISAATLAHRYLTSRRLPDAAIDLVDEACARLELEVEVHALEREKDQASKERLALARKAIAEVDDQLRPLQAAYEAQKRMAKADDAERRYDLETASDLRYYALPELQSRLEQLLAKKAEEETNGQPGSDSVTPEQIAEIVARWTGIPVTRLMSTEKEKLLRMEKILANSVVGQPDAAKAVANAIRLSRSGLASANRPIASFLMAGPSGTGKTLMSKTLATILFDSPDAMIRIDGSEYSEKHSIARLIGAPPGYVGHDAGGQLTEYVRRKPYCIVLIDEIEKASREFVTLFLQVLDDGRLTDGQGRVVDFRNTVIIMTSNLGAAYLNDMSEGRVDFNTRQLVMGAIQAHFPPEFVNRIDEIIIFHTLSRDNVLKIVDLRLKEVEDRLSDRKITLDVEPEAKQYLVSVGYNPAFGARPLNRAIQSELLNPLSVLLLSGQIQDNETVHVKFDGPRNKLVIIPNHPEKGVEGMDLDGLDDDIEIEEID
ncbi:P-loop containing nucleoside triphosphate hydrolase protein [Pisolithus tinctorius]|nr:P-loop containing nucleoside triphosphate hydrolase protein [Pisolithus tinctorius]